METNPIILSVVLAVSAIIFAAFRMGDFVIGTCVLLALNLIYLFTAPQFEETLQGPPKTKLESQEMTIGAIKIRGQIFLIYVLIVSAILSLYLLWQYGPMLGIGTSVLFGGIACISYVSSGIDLSSFQFYYLGSSTLKINEWGKLTVNGVEDYYWPTHIDMKQPHFVDLHGEPLDITWQQYVESPKKRVIEDMYHTVDIPVIGDVDKAVGLIEKLIEENDVTLKEDGFIDAMIMSHGMSIEYGVPYSKIVVMFRCSLEKNNKAFFQIRSDLSIDIHTLLAKNNLLG